MLRNKIDLVNEAINEGFTRGIDLFMEQLELDLSKSEIFHEEGFDNVLKHFFLEADIPIVEDDDAMFTDDELEQLDEAGLDNLLTALADDA